MLAAIWPGSGNDIAPWLIVEVQGQGLRSMRNEGPERIGWHLLTDLRRVTREGDRAAYQHQRVSRWRPVSTAPYNRDLELRVAEDGSVATVPFPCRHTNKDEWINVDLGVPLKIQPIEWRAWQQSESPDAHRASIFAPAASAALRLKQWVRLLGRPGNA
jgi:hypothetical protein